jgi:hypothetical protein
MNGGEGTDSMCGGTQTTGDTLNDGDTFTSSADQLWGAEISGDSLTCGSNSTQTDGNFTTFGTDTDTDAPSTEACDGEDNDGDGAVDEDWPDADSDGIADCLQCTVAHQRTSLPYEACAQRRLRLESIGLELLHNGCSTTGL